MKSQDTLLGSLGFPLLIAGTLQNPSLTSDCGNYLTGRSYCVEAPADSEPGPTATDGPSPTTTTSPGNGVTTPTPIQPEMVDNCNKFHFVKKNENCDNIAKTYSITRAQFVTYNPAVGDTCSGMWAEVYVCVGIIGGSPVTTSASPTKTGNGIATPTPSQDGMVDNCDAFHFVEKNQNCDDIAKKYGISRAQFVSYNPAVGDTCSGMWANVYVCVSLIGSEPSPTTTQKPTSTGNGIATPAPTQPEMITDCNKFYLVKSGDTCASIASKNNISQTQFRNFQPSVGTDCKGLWLDAYVCVGRIGMTPSPTTISTTTKTGNGVATPTPIQDGMVKNCNKFEFVGKTTTCQSILDKYKISLAQFYKWNPSVGSGCNNLWGSTYACVGVIS